MPSPPRWWARPFRLGLPLGTLNHFARDLGLPLGLKQAVTAIAGGRSVAVDVGRLNDRTFLNNASIGVYPNIVELRDELQRLGHGRLGALVSATGKVLRTYRGVSAALTSESGRWAGRTPFVFVGNNEYTVDGPKLGGRHSLTSGRIAVYVTPRLRSRQLPRLFARALAGRALRSGSFEVFVTPRLDIELPAAARVRVALDGEIVTLTTPLHFRSDPLALNVLCPGD